MSNKTDISQIKKYLQGKLDAPAMHQLERRAQNDPFLMDALEGYETTGVNNEQLNELSARLQQRIIKKEARIISWRMLAMAASAAVILTIGGLWYYNSEPQTASLTAQIDKTEVVPSPTVQSPTVVALQDSIVKNSEPVAVLKTPGKATRSRRRLTAANESFVAADNNTGMVAQGLSEPSAPAPEMKKQAADLSEMVVMNYAARKADKKTDSIANNQVAARVAAAPGVLNEVAIGYAKKTMDQTTGATSITKKAVQPQMGWTTYDKYIQDNAVSPDGIIGTIKVSFMVNPNGELYGFKVNKSLSQSTDQKAIDLIKNGPAWWGKAQPKQVTVNVKFHTAN